MYVCTKQNISVCQHGFTPGSGRLLELCTGSSLYTRCDRHITYISVCLKHSQDFLFPLLCPWNVCVFLQGRSCNKTKTHLSETCQFCIFCFNILTIFCVIICAKTHLNTLLFTTLRINQPLLLRSKQHFISPSHSRFASHLFGLYEPITCLSSLSFPCCLRQANKTSRGLSYYCCDIKIRYQGAKTVLPALNCGLYVWFVLCCDSCRWHVNYSHVFRVSI